MQRARIPLAFLTFAVCLVSLPLLAGQFPTDPATEARDAAMKAQYDAFGPLSKSGRKAAYAELTPDVQRDVWVVHLERVLAEHPELTAEQRGVIHEGIGLLRAGLFERLYSGDAARIQAANEDVKQLELRAKAVLPLDLATRAFTRIGPGTPAPELADTIGLGGRFKVTANSPYCSCNVETDDCWPDGHCIFWRGSCTFTTGCGWFFTKGCDGLCY